MLLFLKAGFDPSQPRDDVGKWTEGGGEHAHAAKLAHSEIKWTSSQKKNAELVAAAMNGISPDFKVITQNPSGSKTDSRFAAIGSQTNGVLINPRSPYWKDPVASAKYNHSVGHFSTEHPLHAAIHEISHTIHDVPRHWGADQQKLVAAKVGKYASTNPSEFVAETFTGLHVGKRYDDDVMRLYNLYARRIEGRGMSKALLLIKSTIHAHGQSELFPQTVHVKGHVRGNVFIRPSTSTRLKHIEAAPHQPAPKPVFGMFRATSEHREQIVSKLIADRAKNLSDAELHRVLGPTVGGAALARMAAHFRDQGEITEGMINSPDITAEREAEDRAYAAGMPRMILPKAEPTARRRA